ncbi:MAG: TonB-dependent receptor [Bacteroidetes bacterium]|nr:MAG: TonB-dependent receptor [Bacteroidota bacterium]
MLCLLTSTIHSSAQSTIVAGTVIDDLTNKVVAGAVVSEKGFPENIETDEGGVFSLTVHEPASLTLVIVYEGRIEEFQYQLAGEEIHNLGEIRIRHAIDPVDDQFFTISLSDDDASGSDNVSGILTASRDIFESSAAYVFGPARFRVRGYDSENSQMNVNGAPMNDLEIGRVIWSNWGGLNDVTRNRETHFGVSAIPFTFGGIGGGIQLDLRASKQRAQKRFTYSNTNRNYSNRLMGTWSSGLRPDGWAFTISASKRWAQEGYIDGTFYDGYGYFVSVDKKINSKHLLNFVALGAPTSRGRNSAATQEMFEIASSNYYNSYWGYQNGEKRNSRVAKSHQPIFNLRHDWTPSINTVLTSTLVFQKGRYGTTALDWYNAHDPRPDYYRRLPSLIDDPGLADQVWNKLSDNEELRQVQWDRMYDANRINMSTIRNVDGIPGNDVTGKFSQYIVEERRYDNTRFIASTNLQHIVNDQFGIYAGAHYSWQKNHNYKLVEDLLDGDFYVNWDKFAKQDFPNDAVAIQNDLNHPNQLVKEGEVFGYDFDENIQDYGVWGQATWTLPQFDIYAGLSASQTKFWRTGHMKNGKFPDNSFGDSEKFDFFNVGAKGGITYKIDGRNYLSASGLYQTRAPYIRNAMVSSRTRNEFVKNLEQEEVYGGEAGYTYSAPYFKARITGYYTQFNDGTRTRSFYHDEERSFVNLTMTNIDKTHKGLEMAVEGTIFPGFKLHGVAAIGEYRYSSRPVATISQDNNAELLAEDLTIYAENYYVAGGPQKAYTIGASYRSKNYWAFYLNVNYFDDVWIDFNPIRRTTEAVDLVEEGSSLWNSILEQENTGGAMTVNASIFKSFLLKGFEENVFLNLSFSVNNALNNQEFITGGYEQLRFDFEGKDVDRFPSRYYYFQGLNYYFNASIRF